jgi:hypothetical protein
MANRPTHSVIFGQLDTGAATGRPYCGALIEGVDGGGSNSAERAAQEVSLAVDFGELRLNFTSLNRPVVRWPASALVHITDSSLTSSEVRKVP